MNRWPIAVVLCTCVLFGTVLTGVSSRVFASDGQQASGTLTTTNSNSFTTGTTLTTTTSNNTNTTNSTNATAGDTTAPVITDVQVGQIAAIGARIQWSTDDHADSRVAYSVTDGTFSGISTTRCDGGGFVSSHCVYLTNLTPGTRYYYKVQSRNEAGLDAQSAGFSFSTLSPVTTVTSSSPNTSGSGTVSPTVQTIETSQIPPPTTTQPVDVVSTLTTSELTSNDTTVAPNTSAPRILEKITPSAMIKENAPENTVTPSSSTVIVPTSQMEPPRAQLEGVGKSLRSLQKVMRTVNESVQTTVSHDVDRVVRAAALQSERNATLQTDHVFDPQERETRLETLKRAVDAKQSQLSHNLQTSLSSSADTTDHLQDIEPVLKSSLADIALIVKSETGVQVDLSPTARTVVENVQEQSAQFDAARSAFLARGGLDLYTDSDRDGISDYDETHVYHTDPHNAYSGGGSITDGEKVLLGFDVSTSTPKRVAVESPIIAGEETENVFEVYSIAVNKVAISPPDATTTAAVSGTTTIAISTPSSTRPILPTFADTVTFAGRALPNSFITLYVFSTPIVVTVKADMSGAWSYTLNSELPDGAHKLYVATVDAGGKILAKSPAIPFTKTAEAAEFTPLRISETPAVDPLDVLRNNLMTVALAGFAIFAFVALAILGVRRFDVKDGTVTPA